MRIITGEFKGRRLAANPGMTTRPITDRAKIKLFGNLKLELRGLKVIDVFAGTGSMGLEALSRGAATVVLVEFDRKAHEILCQNVEHLGARDRAVCWRVDVLRTSFKPQFPVPVTPYDLIFFDPPYRMAETLHPGQPLFKAVERLSSDDVSAPGATLVLRCHAKTEVELPEAWSPVLNFQQGSMSVMYFRKANGHDLSVTSQSD